MKYKEAEELVIEILESEQDDIKDPLIDLVIWAYDKGREEGEEDLLKNGF